MGSRGSTEEIRSRRRAGRPFTKPGEEGLRIFQTDEVGIKLLELKREGGDLSRQLVHGFGIIPFCFLFLPYLFEGLCFQMCSFNGMNH